MRDREVKIQMLWIYDLNQKTDVLKKSGLQNFLTHGKMNG